MIIDISTPQLHVLVISKLTNVNKFVNVGRKEKLKVNPQQIFSVEQRWLTCYD